MYDVLTVKYKTDPFYKDAIVKDNTYDNVGFSKAINVLLSKTNRDVILLNPDAYPLKDAFSEMERQAYSRPDIGIIQPRLLNWNGSIDSTGHEWTRGKFGFWKIGDRQYEPNTLKLRSACFACVFIKREVIKCVGLFDEQFFLYCEDVDYSLRAKKLGWSIEYCPKASVMHKRHGTGYPLTAEQKKGRLILARKYFFHEYVFKKALEIFK